MSFAFSALAFVLALVSLVVTLEHVSGPAGRRAISIGLPGLLFLVMGVAFVLALRARLDRAQLIAYAASAVGALCMVLSRLISVEPVRDAFSVASSVLFLTGLAAILVAIGRRLR